MIAVIIYSTGYFSKWNEYKAWEYEWINEFYLLQQSTFFIAATIKYRK